MNEWKNKLKSLSSGIPDKIITINKIIDYGKRNTFQNMMLSRLQEETEAYLGKTGNPEKDKVDCRYRNPSHIWGDTIEDNVNEMERLYNTIPSNAKPKWLSFDDIKNLREKLKCLNEIN